MKKYLKEKEESDRQWKITSERIDNTLSKMETTKNDIKRIDDMYDNYQKRLADVIDAAVASINKNKLLENAAEDFLPVKGDPVQVAHMFKQKKKILVLTGAGVSSASGIPTFRDVDGFWTKKK